MPQQFGEGYGETHPALAPDTGGLQVNAAPDHMGGAATVAAQHPAGARVEPNKAALVSATGTTPQTSTPTLAPAQPSQANTAPQAPEPPTAPRGDTPQNLPPVRPPNG